MNTVLTTHADQVLREDAETPDPSPVITVTRKKPTISPITSEGILRQKMRASPRNVVRIGPTPLCG
jgi:hypothetical protein